MTSQTDILTTILGQEINFISMGQAVSFPFQIQNDYHVHNNLSLLTLDKDTSQVHEYEISTSFPIYKKHDNRCKLVIRRKNEPVGRLKYVVKKIEHSTILSVALTISRISLYEESLSSNYLNEIKDYPTLTSTVALGGC